MEKLTTEEQREAVAAYRAEAAGKSDRDRQIAKEKTGVFTGSYAINPVNGKKIPIWIADYVMMGYGTGAIMAVPGQDERDWEFAEKFDLPIVRTVQTPEDWDGKAFTGEGVAINSDFLDGLGVAEAKAKMTDWLEAEGLGTRKVNYKLRDWLFSRQRYWGEPFPLLKLADGTVRLLEPDELPLTLPEVGKYEPAGTGEGPLATIDEWMNIDRPEERSEGPAREQHHAPVGRQLLVLPALHRSAQHRARPGTRTWKNTGCRWTCTWAAPSTRCCTCCTPASGTRSCSTWAW